ncbi:hypothetical protein ACHAWF_018306, partial [Thalassiosira exigua]
RRGESPCPLHRGRALGDRAGSGIDSTAAAARAAMATATSAFATPSSYPLSARAALLDVAHAASISSASVVDSSECYAAVYRKKFGADGPEGGRLEANGSEVEVLSSASCPTLGAFLADVALYHHFVSTPPEAGPSLVQNEFALGPATARIALDKAGGIDVVCDIDAGELAGGGKRLPVVQDAVRDALEKGAGGLSAEQELQRCRAGVRALNPQHAAVLDSGCDDASLGNVERKWTKVRSKADDLCGAYLAAMKEEAEEKNCIMEEESLKAAAKRAAEGDGKNHDTRKLPFGRRMEIVAKNKAAEANELFGDGNTKHAAARYGTTRRWDAMGSSSISLRSSRRKWTQ